MAVGTVVLITTRFGGTPYEVSLHRVPWLSEQSYVNAQSLQAVDWPSANGQLPGNSITP